MCVIRLTVVFSTLYEIHPVAWILNVIRKWLVIPMIFVPLLHEWANLVRPDVIVGHRVHSWITVMITFLFLYFA